MKYLKEYNHKDYTQIDHDEFDTYLNYGSNLIDFTKEDLSLISSITFDCIKIEMQKNLYHMRIEFESVYMDLFKTEDDWFYISLDHVDYYRCDQLNGVRDCIEMLRNYNKI